ncbi:hypothetical protein B0T21DRAFT_413462 [Apiosordaria backusii]|uniref:Uncharacterized protein n=1 Tax=Apiosordaria backusii TaxID=314023 RepID=A0AA40B876_9PEZI|nr:hypothetical protein B0T21DRAFT_413462 [Apiosordaria backusii]
MQMQQSPCVSGGDASAKGLSRAIKHAQSRLREKLQPNTNAHGEITIHSISRPIPVADNAPVYRGVRQQTTTTTITPPPTSSNPATMAIRSTPKLVYHHPRRHQSLPQSQHYTTSYPRSLIHPKPLPQPQPRNTTPYYIHYTSPSALTFLSQLKSFLLLPPTTPNPTLLLNLLTKHNKVRLHLPRKNLWLAGWINKINWYGVHKHFPEVRSLTKSERWVLEHFVKRQRGLFDVGGQGYDLAAIAERLGECETKLKRGKRLRGQDEQEGRLSLGWRLLNQWR